MKVTLVEKCKLCRRQLFSSSPFWGCFGMIPPLRASETYISCGGTVPFSHPRVRFFYQSSAVLQLPSCLLLGIAQLGRMDSACLLEGFRMAACWRLRPFYVPVPTMSVRPLLSACFVYPAAHYLRLACQNRLNILWEIWSHPWDTTTMFNTGKIGLIRETWSTCPTKKYFPVTLAEFPRPSIGTSEPKDRKSPRLTWKDIKGNREKDCWWFVLTTWPSDLFSRYMIKMGHFSTLLMVGSPASRAGWGISDVQGTVESRI